MRVVKWMEGWRRRKEARIRQRFEGDQAALSVNFGKLERNVRPLVGARLSVSAEMALSCFDDVTHNSPTSSIHNSPC